MSQFNSPISDEKANRLISLLEVTKDARVLDAGCGRGEFLIRLIEATHANGLGIDCDRECIEEARRNSALRIPHLPHEFRLGNMRQEHFGEKSFDLFDLTICMGSTHAFGAGEAAYPNTLKALTGLLRPGGKLLVGEGYWKQTPAPDYLRLIGDPIGIYRDHAANISFAEQCGLIPLYAAVGSDDEWDHFEWTHWMRIEKEAELHPDDPAVAEKLQRSRQWRDGYLRWGRGTMGFGYYLFAKPAKRK